MDEEQKNKPGPVPKKKRSKSLLFRSALLVLLAGAGGATYYFSSQGWRQTQSSPPPNEQNLAAQKPEKIPQRTPTTEAQAPAQAQAPAPIPTTEAQAPAPTPTTEAQAPAPIPAPTSNGQELPEALWELVEKGLAEGPLRSEIATHPYQTAVNWGKTAQERQAFRQNKKKRHSASLPESPPELEAKTEKRQGNQRKHQGHLMLGMSLANFSQDNFFKQNPQSFLVGGEYQLRLKSEAERSAVLGLSGVVGALSFNEEPSGTLQCANGGIKLGYELINQEKVQWKFLTGTQIYTSFGNSLIGYNTLVGQGLETQLSFDLPKQWQLSLSGAWIPILSKGVSILSNHRELAGHLMISHKKVGAFGGISDLRLLKNPGPLHFQAFRFGAFFRF